MMFLYYFRDIVIFDAYQDLETVLLSASFLFNLFPGHMEGFVWASWTIGIEMLFYAIFPFVCRYADTFFKSLIILAVSIALYKIWSFVISVYIVP